MKDTKKALTPEACLALNNQKHDKELTFCWKCGLPCNTTETKTIDGKELDSFSVCCLADYYYAEKDFDLNYPYYNPWGDTTVEDFDKSLNDKNFRRPFCVKCGSYCNVLIFPEYTKREVSECCGVDFCIYNEKYLTDEERKKIIMNINKNHE